MPTIKVEYTLDVQAKPERLWDVLTDFKSWPEWQWTSYIQPIPPSPLKGGCAFVAELGGHKWNMAIAKADRPKKVSWHARSTGLEALHEWEFLDQGRMTKAISRESMSGWLLPFVYPIVKRNIQKVDEKWLADLKSRAENLKY
jgi:hypothetical protein